uniref:SHSP domain-containing protein n=1 Tax=Fagus sylvatica TaxID=28930 RepID=A0A2N9GGH8_FAGSY
MRIDWRETGDPGGSHFQGAPSGLKKEDVMTEVEDEEVKANMENAVLSVPKEKKHGEAKVIEISG